MSNITSSEQYIQQCKMYIDTNKTSRLSIVALLERFKRNFIHRHTNKGTKNNNLLKVKKKKNKYTYMRMYIK